MCSVVICTNIYKVKLKVTELCIVLAKPWFTAKFRGKKTTAVNRGLLYMYSYLYHISVLYLIFSMRVKVVNYKFLQIFISAYHIIYTKKLVLLIYIFYFGVSDDPVRSNINKHDTGLFNFPLNPAVINFDSKRHRAS